VNITTIMILVAANKNIITTTVVNITTMNLVAANRNIITTTAVNITTMIHVVVSTIITIMSILSVS